MAIFNPPSELNGIPLSERSRFLLYWPIEWLLSPSVTTEPVAFLQKRLWFVDDTPRTFKSSMTADEVFQWKAN